MKEERENRVVKINKENREWKLQQQLSRLIEKLDRLPDANEVQHNAARSAPQGIAEMVF